MLVSEVLHSDLIFSDYSSLKVSIKYCLYSLCCTLHLCILFIYFFSESENFVYAQSCPTLCDPLDYIVHGILQARILEWVAFPFSRGSFQPRSQMQVSWITGTFFTSWDTGEDLLCSSLYQLIPFSYLVPPPIPLTID